MVRMRQTHANIFFFKMFFTVPNIFVNIHLILRNVHRKTLLKNITCQKVKSESCSVVSDFLRPHGLQSPWNSPGQNTGVGSLSLLQGILPTQGSNPGLPHCRQILYQLTYGGRPTQVKAVINSSPYLTVLLVFYLLSILGKNSNVQNLPLCPNQQQWDNSQEVRIINLYENSDIQSNSLEYFKQKTHYFLIFGEPVTPRQKIICFFLS